MMNTVRKSENLFAVPCHFRSGKRRHNRHVRDLEALRGLHSETLYRTLNDAGNTYSYGQEM